MADEIVPEGTVTDDSGALQGTNTALPPPDLIPHDKFVPDTAASNTPGAPPELIPHDQFVADEDKYGTLGQQAKAGLEGLAQGVAGPLATAAEVGMGVKPEDIRGREEANPWTHGIAQGVGLVGSSALGVGEGAILEGAGQAAKGLIGATKGGFLNQVGPEAIKAAFEGALFQGGEELSKKFKEDPEQSAGSAMLDIGLSSVMSGVFGGTVGALLNKSKVAEGLAKTAEPAFVSELDRPALEAGDFAASIKHADNLKPEARSKILGNLLDNTEKSEAPEIKAAAKRLGAPVLEGMVSNNEWIQKGEDALINGAPTYSGIKRAQLYNDAYNKASGAVEEALGDPSRYTKAELGDIMKTSLSEQLRAQNEPIAQMYNMLKETHEAIPLSEKSAPAIARNLEKLQEFKLSPSSPEGQLVKRVMAEIGNLQTVDDVKTYKSILNRSLSPTASSGEKRMAAILSDKLTDLEESSIERFAKNEMKTPEAYKRVMGLIDQRQAANAQYKELITKIKTLSEQLGKGRVYGIQDALHFINEKLTPEEVVQRLGTTKDSAFRKFFEKEFPEQHGLMQEYQKGALRAQASKSGELSHKVLFNNVNKMEPEIQKSIFAPAELQKIKDAETYIRSFPKNFNPGGTSGMSAFREFFSHPMGAAAANARDFAIEKFIKNVASSPEVENAVSLAQSAIKGEKMANRAVKSIFSHVSEIPLGALPTISARTKLDKIVTMYAANPDKMLNTGDNNPVPQYAESFSAASARAVQYLNSVKPNTEKQSPLDSKRKPSPAEQASYDRALDIAQNPLSIVDKMRQGTMTTQDINTLKAIHPGVYKSLQEKMMASVMDQSTKGKTIPYATRLQLSQFLGQPLDSTMTPKSILSAQAKPIQQSQQPPPQSSTAKLSGIPKSSMTSSQKRESVRAGQQKD